MTHLEKLKSLLNGKSGTTFIRAASGQKEFNQVLDAAPPAVLAMFKEQPGLYGQLIRFAEDRLDQLLRSEESNNEHVRTASLQPIVNRFKKYTMQGEFEKANQQEKALEIENTKLEEKYEKARVKALGSAIIALHGEVNRIAGIAESHVSALAAKEEQELSRMTPHEIQIAILKELRSRK